MAKFLVELPHESNEVACIRAINLLLSTGSHVLTRAEWGCRDGEHKAWVIVDMTSKEEVRAIIPPIMRPDAKIVRLNKFTLEEVEELIRVHQPQL